MSNEQNPSRRLPHLPVFLLNLPQIWAPYLPDLGSVGRANVQDFARTRPPATGTNSHALRFPLPERCNGTTPPPATSLPPTRRPSMEPGTHPSCSPKGCRNQSPPPRPLWLPPATIPARSPRPTHLPPASRPPAITPIPYPGIVPSSAPARTPPNPNRAQLDSTNSADPANSASSAPQALSTPREIPIPPQPQQNKPYLPREFPPRPCLQLPAKSAQ